MSLKLRPLIAQFLPAATCVLGLGFSLVWAHSLLSGIVICIYLLSLLVVSVIAGRALLDRVPLKIGGKNEFPLTFLTGYFTINCILFGAAFISPVSIGWNYTAICLVFILWYFVGKKPPETTRESASPINLVVFVAVMAALIWTAPDRTIYFRDGNRCIFPEWVDFCIHSGNIAAFSEAQGSWDLQNPNMAGMRLFVFHYASYFESSALTHFTGLPPLEVYCRFWLPVSFLIAGLSAYVLARQWWSAEASAMATCGLLLIPDATWQGLVSTWNYGFFWMMHATPALGYGLGITTLAWVFMLAACSAGSFTWAMISLVIGGIILPYKVQLFFNNALLLWFLPIFCLKGISWRSRITWLLPAILLPSAVLYVASHTKGMPFLTVNGGGKVPLLAFFETTPLGAFIMPHIAESSPLNYVIAAIWLYFTLCGFWGVVFLFLYTALPSSRTPFLKAMFPLMVLTNFIVLNIALDPTSPELGDEFSHRPFVWAYLVVVVWVSATLYSLLVERLAHHKRRKIKNLVIAACAMCFMFPLALNWAIIDPMRIKDYAFSSFPQGFISCADFVHKNSERGEIVQDLDMDPHYLLSGLTGRREWVSLVYYHFYEEGAVKTKRVGYAQRIAAIEAWRLMSRTPDILNFAKAEHIRWVIVDDDSNVHWPSDLLNTAAFTSGGYRILKLF